MSFSYQMRFASPNHPQSIVNNFKKVETHSPIPVV